MHYVTVVAVLDGRQYLPEFRPGLLLGHPAVPGDVVCNEKRRISGPGSRCSLLCVDATSSLPAPPAKNRRSQWRQSVKVWLQRGRKDQPNKHWKLQLTEYLALAGVLRHQINHVLRFHHLQRRRKIIGGTVPGVLFCVRSGQETGVWFIYGGF